MPKKPAKNSLPAHVLGDLLVAMGDELKRRTGKKKDEPGGAFSELSTRWAKALEGERNRLFDVFEAEALKASGAREALVTGGAAELARRARGEVDPPSPAEGHALVTGHLAHKKSRAPLPDAPMRLGRRKGRRVEELARTFSDAYGTYHFELDGRTLAAATEGGSELVVEVLDSPADSANAVASKAIAGLAPGGTAAVSLGIEGDALPDAHARGERLVERVAAEAERAENEKGRLRTQREALSARLEEARLEPLVRPPRLRPSHGPIPSPTKPDDAAQEPERQAKEKRKKKGKRGES